MEFSDNIIPFSAPANLEAEAALLAAILMKPSTYDIVAGALLPEHFFDLAHGRLFAALEREIAAGRTPTAITLSGEFDKDWLRNLAASVVTFVNNSDYAQTIIDAWRRRELVTAAATVRVNAEASGTSIEQTRDDLDSALTKIFANYGERDLVALGQTIDPTLDRINEAYKNGGAVVGVSSGLVDLDRTLGGLMRGCLYIVAGRPGMGKSTCAKTMALEAARAGHTIGYFSLEMSTEQLNHWCLADLTGISASKQVRGRIDENEIARLTDAAGDLRSLPLYFDDTAALSMPQIRARCRRLKRLSGLALVVIDHIGLLRASEAAKRGGRVQELTEITGDLKRLAKDLDVPVVALSQINRGVENREDKRPGLADLRDSGSIEQDADVVIFAYREEYYLRDEPQDDGVGGEKKHSERLNAWHEAKNRSAGLADLIIAKHRNGPLKTVKVRFEPEYARMSNWAGF